MSLSNAINMSKESLGSRASNLPRVSSRQLTTGAKVNIYVSEKNAAFDDFFF